MSASAPWSVKGIDAKAREVAKDLARRSGMTLGEWLNQMILEGEDVGAMISRERDREPEARQPAPQPEPLRRRPVYRETHNDLEEPVRRPAAFSSSARPLSSPAFAARASESPARASESPAREISSSDLRRRSIFEDRPRLDEDAYAPSHNEMSRVATALESLSARIEGSESRSAGAVRGVSSAVESLLDRLERSEAGVAESLAQTQAETRERLEEQALDIRASFDRNEEGRERLSGRLEQAERLIDAQAERLEGLSGHLREERETVARLEAQLKSTQVQETVKAVEGALGKLANQLYEGEQRHRDVVKDIRQDMVGLSHRVTQSELRDPERAAQSLIDKVVAQMAQRLEQAEAQTSGAIRALEQAFTTLDARLGRAEERGDVTDPESVQSLKRLANDLSRRVEDSRAELLNALNDRSSTTTEQLLRTLSDRVEQSEKRSAAAIERLGQDVVRIAATLDRRVAGVEASSSEGLSRVEKEIGRVHETIDQRFGRTDSSHAQALERLGGEIARISERLTLRMAESERRTSQAVEGIGNFIEQHRDQTRSELSDRIRQSEERTSKLLDEARARLDQKLASVATQTLLSENLGAASRASARPAPADLPNPFAADIAPAPQAQAAPQQATPHVSAQPAPKPAPKAAAPAFAQDDDFDTLDIDDPAVDVPELDGPAVQSATAYAAPETRSEIFTPEFDPFAEDDLEYDLVPVGQAPQASAAERDDNDPFADIDVSRKTAPRAAAMPAARATFEVEDEDGFDDPRQSVRDLVREEDGGVSVSTRDALAAARAAVRASMEGIDDDRRPASGLGGLGLKAASRSRSANPARGRETTAVSAFKASAIAVAVMGVGALGVVATTYLGSDQDVPQPSRNATPIAAAVVTPDLHDQGLLKAKYDTANRLLQARAPGAVDKLQEVASQGYAPAQFVLSDIYTGRGNYVEPNAQEARKWAQRAADGGIAGAMYNLGTMYYSGDGGPKNQITAAMWFRKAAERGVSNSQYNLALLYAQGVAMPLNPTEAYKWFSIAANAGDKDAAREAEAIRASLTPDQRQKAEAAAKAFVPIRETVDSGSAPTAG